MKSAVLIVLVALSCQALGNICGRSESGAKIDYENCSKFYICDNGHENHLECPANLYFDGQACNHRELVPECVGGSRVPGAEPTPVDPQPEVPQEPEPEVPAPVDPVPEVPAPIDPVPVVPAPVDGNCPAGVAFYYLAHPSDCNRFLVCQNGALKGDSNCQPGLVFQPSKQACVYPTGSGCPQ